MPWMAENKMAYFAFGLLVVVGGPLLQTTRFTKLKFSVINPGGLEFPRILQENQFLSIDIQSCDRP